MNLLKERILRDGKVLPGNVLKVDSFLNHQLDAELVDKIGEEFFKLFSSEKIDKVLTVEASGIAIAIMVASKFKIPMLFAKKNQTSNISSDVYSASVASYTHGRVYNICVSKNYLNAGDRVLIIDDFLAIGNALKGLISLVEQAGATVVGCGTVIEKGYQGGGDELRSKGIRVESLAIIDSMEDGVIKFRE